MWEDEEVNGKTGLKASEYRHGVIACSPRVGNRNVECGCRIRKEARRDGLSCGLQSAPQTRRVRTQGLYVGPVSIVKMSAPCFCLYTVHMRVALVNTNLDVSIKKNCTTLKTGRRMCSIPPSPQL
jgi:hypothetical protein